MRWIIDPLDGTVNYLYGLPGLGGQRRRRAGRDGGRRGGDRPGPGRGLHRRSGGGAGCARQLPAVPLRCNTGVALAEALVATGFGYDGRRAEVQGEVVAALLPQVRDIRRGGSCAVDLCSVAAGRVDAYYERGVNYWDYAAGGLVATEAGARLGGLAGRPAEPGAGHRGRAGAVRRAAWPARRPAPRP